MTCRHEHPFPEHCTQCKVEEAQWGQPEAIRVGPYTLSKSPSGYWLQHDSGEGMGIPAKTVLAAIEELWKDF